MGTFTAFPAYNPSPCHDNHASLYLYQIFPTTLLSAGTIGMMYLNRKAILPFTVPGFVKGLERKLKRLLESLNPGRPKQESHYRALFPFNPNRLYV
jgi:hypothetical protein